MDVLCAYCDNNLMPTDLICRICDAEVNKVINIEPTEYGNSVKCARLSGGSDTGESKLVARGAFEQQVIMEPTKSTWTCSVCTFVNDSDHLCCDTCFTEKIAVEESTQVIIDTEFTVASILKPCTTLKEENSEQRNSLPRAISTVHTWECMKCSFDNAILALRCSMCSSNNQIYRLCTKCNRCFIMNDNDTHCTKCPTKSNTSKNHESKGRTPNFGSLIFSMKSKQSVEGEAVKRDGDERKDHKKGTLNSMKSMFNLKKSKKWFCSDSQCRTENRNGGNCKKCGREWNWREVNGKVDDNVERDAVPFASLQPQ